MQHPTPGETNLSVLLRSANPILQEGKYVFCTLPDLAGVDQENLIGYFREKEGITVILAQNAADALSLPYAFIAAWITLTVHSSLAAVGLTAAFSTALAKAQVSCNVIAAYYHDHIFVPYEDRDIAMEVLSSLADF
ncbi:MAG: ACT domain-containing protein [Lewinellaceae bacterium]|nr:ACT domain-containing protein [Lewinellaceae bacterium]